MVTLPLEIEEGQARDGTAEMTVERAPNVRLPYGTRIERLSNRVARAQHANITTWDEVKSLTEGELRARMFPGERERKVPGYERADFDPGYVHKEPRGVVTSTSSS